MTGSYLLSERIVDVTLNKNKKTEDKDYENRNVRP